jgi:hypothetical protein
MISRHPLNPFLFPAAILLALLSPAAAQEADTALLDSSVIVFEGVVKSVEFLGSNDGQIVHKAQLKVLKSLSGDMPESIDLLISNPMEVEAQDKDKLRVLSIQEEGRFKLKLLLTDKEARVFRFMGQNDDYKQLKAGQKTMPAPWPLVRQGSPKNYDPQQTANRWLTLQITLGVLIMLCSLISAWFIAGNAPAVTITTEEAQPEIGPEPGASAQASKPSDVSE